MRHPISDKYFMDYITSISNQTYKNFDIYLPYNLLNKDIDKVNAYKNMLDSVKDYKYIIFTDTDDIYHKDYVKIMRNQLTNSKIVFSDMNLFNDEGVIVYKYLTKCRVPKIVDMSFLQNKNCIGMGNSGIQGCIYSSDIGIPNTYINFDWWLFKNLMKRSKCTATFIQQSLHHYRQYNKNINSFKDINKRALWGEK